MRFLKTTTYPKLACLGLIGLALPWFAYSQSTGDAALNAIRAADRNDRAAKEASQLTSAEHLRRGTIYLANRLFNEAREHWQAIISNPNDTNTPAALLGMARSYYVERRYEEARQTYERVARDYPQTKEGREGLNFSASSLLRMGRGVEAAARYAEYLEKYPTGERVDTAHLNMIDGYRESGRTRDAIDWIERTKQKFPGTVTETGANFARVRLDIAIGDWPHAVQTADELMRDRCRMDPTLLRMSCCI
jgi:TolA-binding protein